MSKSKLLCTAALFCLMAGCTTTPRPYPSLKPEGSAKLRVEDTTAFYSHFHPDGYNCGPTLVISSEQMPFVRQDKTLLLKPASRSALRFVWVDKIDRRHVCSAIVAFEAVPNGEYKLKTNAAPDGTNCSADVIPLNAYSARGFGVWQMIPTGTEANSRCEEVGSNRSVSNGAT
jgi:hypothetical protein